MKDACCVGLGQSVRNAEKFKLVYQPIRHSYIAHRGKISDKEIHELFAETNIGDVKESLKLLYTMLTAIRELYNNGTMLNLDDTAEYERFVQELEDEIGKLVGSLP
jgi:vacuolar-type H+-ATPase subunit C/Vma6